MCPISLSVILSFIPCLSVSVCLPMQRCATRETNIARNIAQRGKRTLLATLCNKGNEHCSQHCATRETNIARNTVQQGKGTLLATLCNLGNEHCSQHCATRETNIARNAAHHTKPRAATRSGLITSRDEKLPLQQQQNGGCHPQRWNKNSDVPSPKQQSPHQFRCGKTKDVCEQFSRVHSLFCGQCD